MPCTDGGGWSKPEWHLDHNELTAVVCAISRTLKNRGELDLVLKEIDWEEAGVSLKQVKKWLKHHWAEDAKRIAEQRKKEHEEMFNSEALRKARKLGLSEKELEAIAKVKKKMSK